MLRGDAIVLGYGFDRVSFVNPIAGDVPRIGRGVVGMLPGSDRYQKLCDAFKFGPVEVVSFLDLLGGRVVRARQDHDGLTGMHGVITPPQAFVRRDGRNRTFKLILGSGREVKLE